MTKRGLGKGLQALIPDVDEAQPSPGVVQIKVDQIEPNPHQPRKSFDPAKLAELAASIKEHGVVQPVVVRQVAGGRFELVTGERRWRACQLNAIDSIPAIIKDYTERQVTEVALIENIQREDLSPLEEAWAYQTLIEEFGLTQEAVAVRVGRSRPYVANMLRLLALPPAVREQINNGVLTAGHARALLSLPPEQIEAASARIAAQGLSVRQAEDLVRRMREDVPPSETSRAKRPENKFAELEERLKETLGTQVRIKERGTIGKIEIEYYSEEELTRLAEKLIGENSFT